MSLCPLQSPKALTASRMVAVQRSTICPSTPSEYQRRDRRAAERRWVANRLGATDRLCETLVLWLLLAGLRPGLDTGRIARSVRSRRFKFFQQLLGSP